MNGSNISRPVTANDREYQLNGTTSSPAAKRATNPSRIANTIRSGAKFWP